MARVPSKHERDHNLDFQGLLNDLQDWELNLKNRDNKKMMMKEKKQQPQAPSQIGEDRGLASRTPAVNSPKSNSGQYPFSRDFYGISHLSSSFMTDENTVDAASEKELGNEYFKQKKFKEAIDCYSRSIALSPTAVAYANRAMAYLKIKRFREAEEDCTEALNLDDHYIKAYSRRATARKELGKLKESIEDSEFAMRLEPNNQEIRKQYADVKSLYEKVLLQKASEVLKSSAERAQKGESLETRANRVAAVDSLSSQKDLIMENDGRASVHKSPSVKELESRVTIAGSQTESQAVKHSLVDASQRKHRTGKQELKASIQELASRAASQAMTEASKSIVPPTSAYEFEASWRGLLGDHVLQSQLLKVTSPSALPQIFKNALSASLLLDIINCVATFFCEDMDLAVKYLQNLTKIPRFDMLVMFLSATDKADLRRKWNEVFCNEATPIEYAEILENLRPKYCLN